ncbi:unnamed protein product [Mycena citricolor]|uniref:F-box domain-containing protein n=1 Tax=Mycena citricolor TaxID=2018698 RepID=A0AAD2Q6R0_9AGAR|nr:unnamed protein product [Mycena citricolor]
MVTLLDCPNELLLIISEYLNDEGLLHFASTCIRVNSLLIHILLERCQCEAVVSSTGAISSVYFTGDNLGAIPALAIAYHATSIELLSCGFSSFFRSSSSKEILNAVKALDVLAKRLERLSHVRIHPLLKFPGTKKEYVSWQKLLALSLNSAALRGDCSITVYNEPYEAVVDPFPFSHSFSDRPTTAHIDGSGIIADTTSRRAAGTRDQGIEATYRGDNALRRAGTLCPTREIHGTRVEARDTLARPPRAEVIEHTLFPSFPHDVLPLDDAHTQHIPAHLPLARQHRSVAVRLARNASPPIPRGARPSASGNALLYRRSRPEGVSSPPSQHHLPRPQLPRSHRPTARARSCAPKSLPHPRHTRVSRVLPVGPPAGDIHPLLREVTITSHGGSVYEEDRFAKVVAALEKRGSVPAVGLVGKLMGVLDLPETLVPLGNTLEEDENGNR